MDLVRNGRPMHFEPDAFSRQGDFQFSLGPIQLATGWPPIQLGPNRPICNHFCRIILLRCAPRKILGGPHQNLARGMSSWTTQPDQAVGPQEPRRRYLRRQAGPYRSAGRPSGSRGILAGPTLSRPDPPNIPLGGPYAVCVARVMQATARDAESPRGAYCHHRLRGSLVPGGAGTGPRHRWQTATRPRGPGSVTGGPGRRRRGEDGFWEGDRER